MTPAQTDTPSPIQRLSPSLERVPDGDSYAMMMPNPSGRFMSVENHQLILSHVVKVAEEALEACLKKGSKWHPCDPVVVQAQAALSELQRIAKP